MGGIVATKHFKQVSMNKIIDLIEVQDIAPPGERYGKYMAGGLDNEEQLLIIISGIERAFKATGERSTSVGFEVEVRQESMHATIAFLNSLSYMTYLYRTKIGWVYLTPLGDILLVTVG